MPAAARTMDRRDSRGAPVFMVSPKLSGTRGHTDVRKFTMSATSPACNGSMSTQPPGNPEHAVYAAQMLKLRRTQEFQLPLPSAARQRGQVVTPDRPHPPVELVTIAARPEPASSSSAVPPICPKHRSRRSSTDNSGSSPRPLSCTLPALGERPEGASQARGSTSTLVRAGSAQHRKPLVLGGHERSRSASENRRSRGRHRSNLTAKQPGAVRIPPPPPQRPAHSWRPGLCLLEI